MSIRAHEARVGFVKRNPRIAGVLFAVVGFIVASIAFKEGEVYGPLLSAQPVLGVVAKVGERGIQGKRAFEYKWKDSSGTTRQGSIQTKLSDLVSNKPGDAVMVLIDPSDPTHAVPVAYFESKGIVTIAGRPALGVVYVGLILMAIGLLFVVIGPRIVAPG